MPDHYVFFGTDKPGHGQVRADCRELHRSYIRTRRNGVVAVVGGPTFGADGQMNGTMLVLEGDSLEAVRDFIANDPYGQAGLFAQTEVRRWHWGLGQPGAG